MFDGGGPARGGQLGQGGVPALLQVVQQAGFEFGGDVAVDVLDLVRDAVTEAARLGDLGCETVIHTYRGALGREHTSSEWLVELQLNARYRYLCALTSLAQLTLDTDPDRTLGLLETARLHEPTNEDIYRSIMTIHDHQHRPDAALNTYALLQAHLDNLDNTLTPEPATTALALRIRDTHTQRLRRTPRSA